MLDVFFLQRTSASFRCRTASLRGGARNCIRCHQEKVGQHLIKHKLTEQHSFPSMQAGYEGVLDYQEAVEGWALKTVQKSSRMSEDVRNYLIQRFNDGAKTGNKAGPKQVEHEMKHVRNTIGGLLFQPYEWRTSKQIASFQNSFARSAFKEH